MAADTVYLFQVANGTYTEGTWLERALAAVFVAAGAGPLGAPARRRAGALGQGWRDIALPAVGALAALGVLFVDHGAVTVNDPARYLALATLLLVASRIVLIAFRRSRRSEQVSRVQPITDALTGLGNRRLLIEDLDETIGDRKRSRSATAGAVRPQRVQGLQRQLRAPGGGRALARLGQNLADRRRAIRQGLPHGRR